jgi:hypothetical protein
VSSDGIVERLQNLGDSLYGDGDADEAYGFADAVAVIADEAADTINHLDAIITRFMTDNARLRAEIADLHNAINWEVNCTRCADLLDKSYIQHADVERLRAAIDTYVTEVDGCHTPEWASDQAKANGKEPWCCEWCGPQDGGWPCVHRMALDRLKEARREHL